MCIFHMIVVNCRVSPYKSNLQTKQQLLHFHLRCCFLEVIWRRSRHGIIPALRGQLVQLV